MCVCVWWGAGGGGSGGGEAEDKLHGSLIYILYCQYILVSSAFLFSLNLLGMCNCVFLCRFCVGSLVSVHSRGSSPHAVMYVLFVVLLVWLVHIFLALWEAYEIRPFLMLS